MVSLFRSPGRRPWPLPAPLVGVAFHGESGVPARGSFRPLFHGIRFRPFEPPFAIPSSMPCAR